MSSMTMALYLGSGECGMVDGVSRVLYVLVAVARGPLPVVHTAGESGVGVMAGAR